MTRRMAALAAGSATVFGAPGWAASTTPATAKPAVVKAWDVPARRLPGGAQGDVGYQVFYSEKAWADAVKQRPWTGAKPDLPRVNWQNEMVITATDGTKPTAGYSVQITGVRRVGTDIVVQVRESGPAADAVAAQVITYPSDAVAVRRMDGPVQFVITKDEGAAPGLPPGVTPSAGDAADAPAVTTLAKSLFIIRQEGGIAGLNDQTVVHLYGRPVLPSEIPSGARKTTDVQVAGPVLRDLENAVRESGFLNLEKRYAPDKGFPDQMTRTITVKLPGATKTVSVLDGATGVPVGFDKVWAAIQDAIRK